MSLAGAAIVSAETILSLTPIAIKKTAVDPTSAMWSRLLTSAVLGYGLTGEHSVPSKEWGQAAALGYTNLLHVASSYESFRHLPAGQAMSLLYTYPFWNLILVSIFNHEAIAMRDYGIMAIATVGSILLNLDPGHAATTTIGREINPGWGVFMGLIMALTESGMHTLLKGLNWLDAAKSVWVVNSSAAVWLAGALLLQGGMRDMTGSVWDNLLLTAFHAVTMFSGYWLRYFAVPRLSTVTYSILSYAGMLASYLFGYLFLKEKPGWMTLLGTLIIVGAGLALTLPKQSATS